MKKIFKVCMCGLVAATVISGCGKAPEKETTAEETTAAESMETQAGQPTEAMEMVDLSTVDNGTITLGEYKGIEVTKEDASVTDEAVDAAIQGELEGQAAYMEVERAVEDGDQVNIDYVGTKDGVAFDGGTAQGTDLNIGSGQFIDGFESGLIGAKKGDKVNLNLTFPEDYGKEDLAGQAVVFEVTVNAVKEKQIPELNDAFVQEVSEFKTVDEYRDDVMQTLLAEKNAEADRKVENDLLKAVMDASEINPNQEAIDANFNNTVANYTNQASAFGLDLATFAGFYGMTEDSFKEEMKAQAESIVKQRLVFNAIAEKESITVSDEDREGVAEEMGYESAAKLIEATGQYALDDYITSTKAMKIMVDHAVIK